MALLILRTTPGDMVRWLSGTATQVPFEWVLLEWRPPVLVRVNPAALSRFITVRVASSLKR